MTARAWLVVAVVVSCAVAAGEAGAQGDTRLALARDLARLLVEDPARRSIEDQVGAGMMQAMGSTLEGRLNRRLLEIEWQALAGIVRRFIAEALPPQVTEELAAEVYARHFDERELDQLLAFQRSPVGRKAWRLSPVIARDTAEAVDREMRRSPAAPRMLEELRRAFPVLGPLESP
ncbi:MAG: DUF2059 domain-containing protein [Candidatus Rokubacteria bacterium]|nr:DUF2059 domain-containing protein [Candidatus Rokubacteria bacterium]